MIVGAGLPSVSVHLMVTDIPTRVVTFVAGMIVREGWTGEGEGEGEGRGRRRGKAERGGRRGRQREEGGERREEREVGRRVGRLGETRREYSILANKYCIKGLHKSPHTTTPLTHTYTHPTIQS